MHTPRCIPPTSTIHTVYAPRGGQVAFASGGSLASPTSLKMRVPRPCALWVTTEESCTLVLTIENEQVYIVLPAGGGRVIVDDDVQLASIVSTTAGWAWIEQTSVFRNERDL